jgi:hypothetical protein
MKKIVLALALIVMGGASLSTANAATVKPATIGAAVTIEDTGLQLTGGRHGHRGYHRYSHYYKKHWGYGGYGHYSYYPRGYYKGYCYDYPYHWWCKKYFYKKYY